jgi:4-hydroxythreonine-4-phosphate dehydrogenase
VKVVDSELEKTPVVGITMGDAAGIGPEITMKALADPEMYTICRPLVIGDAKILERANDVVHANLKVHRIHMPDESVFRLGTVDCVDLDLLPVDLPFGQLSPAAGDAAFQFVACAIQLAKDQQIDAICTAPLNKEALHMGGHMYPGHTEILAELTGTQDFAMMLTAKNLRVIHVTTHVGLIDAVKAITPERVHRVIKLVDTTLRKAGVARPKIAVCGINPHAGEHGLFGYGEDEQKVLPAVERAQGEGIDVMGPLPADTVFFRAGRGDFDAVVAMYHDQGHTPVKVLGLEAGVNITVGLPIIRTSVDHGTAFDIAGKGIADADSMKEAIRQAAILAPKRGMRSAEPAQ